VTLFDQGTFPMQVKCFCVDVYSAVSRRLRRMCRD